MDLVRFARHFAIDAIEQHLRDSRGPRSEACAVRGSCWPGTATCAGWRSRADGSCPRSRGRGVAFWMASTDWFAKVCIRSTVRLGNSACSRRISTSVPKTRSARTSGTTRTLRIPAPTAASRSGQFGSSMISLTATGTCCWIALPITVSDLQDPDDGGSAPKRLLEAARPPQTEGAVRSIVAEQRTGIRLAQLPSPGWRSDRERGSGRGCR